MGGVGRCSIFVPALDIGHLSTRRSTASPRGGTGGAWVHPNAPADPRPRDGRRQGRNTRYRGHLSQPDRHATLNPHLHLHCVVVDGVFEPASANGVVFHAAAGVNAIAIARVQESVRQRLLRVFVCRGPLPGDAAQAMAEWEHGGGFSVDASVRITATDRAGRERLLRHSRPATVRLGPAARAPPRAFVLREHPTRSRRHRPGSPDAAGHLPPPLLRCAGVNGRSREISEATASGRSWPSAVVHVAPKPWLLLVRRIEAVSSAYQCGESTARFVRS